MSKVLCGAAFNVGVTVLAWICEEFGGSVFAAVIGGDALAAGDGLLFCGGLLGTK